MAPLETSRGVALRSATPRADRSTVTSAGATTPTVWRGSAGSAAGRMLASMSIDWLVGTSSAVNQLYRSTGGAPGSAGSEQEIRTAQDRARMLGILFMARGRYGDSPFEVNSLCIPTIARVALNHEQRKGRQGRKEDRSLDGRSLGRPGNAGSDLPVHVRRRGHVRLDRGRPDHLER